MRVLIAIHGYKPALRVGGPVITASAVAERLAKKGHQIIVFTCNSNLDEDLDVPLCTPVDVEGVQVWYFPRIEPFRAWLPFIPYLSKSFGYLYSPQMREALENIVPTVDVVHTQMPFIYPTLAAANAACRYFKPLCYHQHGVLDPVRLRFRRLKKSIYLSLIESRALSRATTLIALNEAEERHYRSLGLTNECRIIPNGVETSDYRQHFDGDRILGIPNDVLMVLFMSRLHPLKGCERLIRAFAEVRAHVPNAALIVAGPDEWGLVGDYKRQAADLGIADNVFFPGMVSGDLKKNLLARADVFCLPSDSEGFSVALLEAMASKTALVITPGCNFPEVEASGAGITVAADPRQIAEAITLLLEDRNRREQMGKAGFSLVKERYNWDHVTNQTEAAYEEAIERHNGRSVLRRPHARRHLRFLFNVHAYKPAYEVGGPVKSVSHLAEQLTRRGHDVCVLTSNYNVGRKLEVATDKTYEIEGVRVRYFESSPHLLQRFGLPYFSRSGFFTFGRDFSGWLKREANKYDVFDTQMAFLSSSPLFSRTARELNKVYLYHQRGNLDPARLNFRYYKKVVYLSLREAAAIRRADTLIALTEYEASVFRQHGFSNPIVVIPNGVEERSGQRERSSTKSDPLFLFLGRLHPTKGPEQFLDAFIEYSKNYAGEGIICGPDDFGMLPLLQKKIERTGLNHRIKLLPPVTGEETKALLTKADVFVLPTISEGFSVGILEAMDSGCAILTTPGARFPEVEKERCGLIVDRSVGSLVEGMKQLTSPLSTASECGARGTQLVQSRYIWPKIVDLYEATAIECYEQKQRARCES